MYPVVFSSRVDAPGGLWTPKIGGTFQEGDPSLTSFFIEGRADMKELAGHLRIYFQDVTFLQRKRALPDADRERIVNTYFEGIKNAKLRREALGQEVSDSEDEEDAEYVLKKKQTHDAELEVLFAAEQNKEIPLPRLAVYLSKKKPKTRMTDIHKIGSRVLLHTNDLGLFGREGTLGNFEASLKDVPDALEYLGLVVVKLPNDDPKTETPTVFGFVKLQSAR
jgi:hypothetical protein